MRLESIFYLCVIYYANEVFFNNHATRPAGIDVLKVRDYLGVG